MKTIMNKILNWFKALIALFISAISKGVDFIVAETKKAKDFATEIIDARAIARDDDIQLQIDNPVEWRVRHNYIDARKKAALIGCGVGLIAWGILL